MNTNKILLAGLVGAVVNFVLGYLVWGVALMGFMESNMGSASGVMRAEGDMQWIPLILGNIAIGLLLAIIFGRWASISTFATGAKAGAVIGFLMACAYDLISLGTSHIMTPTGAIVDIVASTVVTAIVGGVVGIMLGRK